MISEKHNRTLIWLNFILLIVVSSAFAAYFIVSRPDNSAGSDGKGVNSMEMIRSELDLTTEQYQKVLVQNDRTFRLYNLVLDMMCENNVALLEELSKPEVNAIALDSLARKYGVLSSSLRKHTIDYFVNVKNICTPEQQKRLTEIFKEMMEMDKQCATCNKKDCPRKERLKSIGTNIK